MVKQSEKMIELDLSKDKLIVNEENRQKEKEDKETYSKKLHILQDSILQIGLQTAITVKRVANDYEIVSGHRRIEAISTMPKFIKDRIVELEKQKQELSTKLSDDAEPEENNKVKEKIEDVNEKISFYSGKEKELPKYNKVYALVQDYENAEDANLALIATNVVSANMSREDKALFVKKMADGGMSQRAIENATGIPKTTVQNLIEYAKELIGEKEADSKSGLKKSDTVVILEIAKKEIVDIENKFEKAKEKKKMTNNLKLTLEGSIYKTITELQSEIAKLTKLKEEVEDKYKEYNKVEEGNIRRRGREKNQPATPVPTPEPTATGEWNIK